MSLAEELARQQALVQAIVAAVGRGTDASLAPLLPALLQQQGARLARGLAVYAANAGAHAEAALAAQYPVVKALVGDESFALLARSYLRAHWPQRGDLAWLGHALPAFLSEHPDLADAPAYLADVAALELALSRAEAAEDASRDLASLTLLGEAEAQNLRLQLLPAVQVLHSPHAVLAIWQAHQVSASEAPSAFEAARQALAIGEPCHALVWRQGWRGTAISLDEAAWRFTAAVLKGQDLALALSAAGEGFDFSAWLALAVQQEVLREVTCVTPATGS